MSFWDDAMEVGTAGMTGGASELWQGKPGQRISRGLGSENGGVGAAPMYGGSQDETNKSLGHYTSEAEAARGRQGPQIDQTQANWDYARNNESRNQSQEALGEMRKAMFGQQPSVAQMQLQQGIDQSIQAQGAMAASARGGPQAQAAASRAASIQGASLQGQGVRDTSMLRAQEIQQARGQYNESLVQQRAQDLQARGMSLQEAQAQAQLEMQQRGLNDQTALGYEGMVQNIQRGNQGAAVANQGYQAGANAQNAQMNQQNAMGLINAGVSAAGSLAGASDVRAKENIRPATAPAGGVMDVGTFDARTGQRVPDEAPKPAERDLDSYMREWGEGRRREQEKLAEERGVDEALERFREKHGAPMGSAARATGAYAAPGTFNQGMDAEYAEAFGGAAPAAGSAASPTQAGGLARMFAGMQPAVSNWQKASAGGGGADWMDYAPKVSSDAENKRKITRATERVNGRVSDPERDEGRGRAEGETHRGDTAPRRRRRSAGEVDTPEYLYDGADHSREYAGFETAPHVTSDEEVKRHIKKAAKQGVHETVGPVPEEQDETDFRAAQETNENRERRLHPASTRKREEAVAEHAGTETAAREPRPEPQKGRISSFVDSIFSDEHEKTKAHTERNVVDNFLSHLTPYTYDYKEPEVDGEGRRMGPMAQDIEQTPEIGRTLVRDTPRGKVIDGKAALTAMMGGLGRLHQRVAELEKGGRRRAS